MKTLPILLKRWGCNWTQIKREGNFALYHQVAYEIEGKVNTNAGANNFVVIKIRKRKANELYNTPAKEDLPSANEYGTYAWNYINENDALRKFNALVRSDENKSGNKRK